MGSSALRCSLCGHSESKVIDSRNVSDCIRRRRQCLKCGARFTTFERTQNRNIFVIKKDGRREEFNREKLLSGIRRACEKRPLPTGTIDKMVDSIENELYHAGKAEISSADIGDLVITKLENLDHIAYIRFASVYRDFRDISSLKEVVDTLYDNKSKNPPAGQLYLMPSEQLVRTKKRKGKQA
jgi:transcriptional repressor NrdR